MNQEFASDSLAPLSVVFQYAEFGDVDFRLADDLTAAETH